MKLIVKKYIDQYQKAHHRELAYFMNMPSLKVAISKASLVKDNPDLFFSHQRRISHDALARFESSLQSYFHRNIKISDFQQLYRSVLDCKVKGVGPLTIYDTALRIGAFLRIAPSEVYLQCGSKRGAKKLKIFTSSPSVPASRFHPALRDLKPSEIENLLCIYEDEIQGA